MFSTADAVPEPAGRSDELGPPAEAPCRSCPYRRDVPSGVWDISEYEKLARYDRDTGEQPTGLFQYHLTDKDSRPAKHRAPEYSGTGLAGSAPAGRAGRAATTVTTSSAAGVLSGGIGFLGGGNPFFVPVGVGGSVSTIRCLQNDYNITLNQAIKNGSRR
ncbi:DUF6283 family protein [Amycolatopsis sp. NPDC051071]|uniref:DUF6283 family protein n=1 Tax=Amycolatopsis sp. NPDC051071 TaxID=3154637 RepID=UPI00343E8615